MKVWLVTIGEPLPTDGDGGDRLFRAGILAAMLTQGGHKVVWWTSTFDHMRKQQRFLTDTTLRMESGMLLKLLHGCGYARNVSLRRLVDHAILAQKFSHQAKEIPRPDVILCSLPPLELPVAVTRYGKANGVPVVVDVRDLWPDLFLDLVPEWIKSICSVALWPLWWQARKACANAFVITGNSLHFVHWGLNLAGRAQTSLDRWFPHGYAKVSLKQSELEEANAFWSRHGLSTGTQDFIACFFGAIGPQSELNVVVEAARRLQSTGRKCKFVLCGQGDHLDSLLRNSADIPSVIFPGWIDAAKICSLMRISHVGLAVYRSNSGYTTNMPNKPIEYLSAGLPVVSSLRGYLEEFLREHACGVTYPNGDAEALAKVIADLDENRQKLTEMSRNARQVSAEKFDADKVYKEMIAYLGEVVAVFRRRSNNE